MRCAIQIARAAIRAVGVLLLLATGAPAQDVARTDPLVSVEWLQAHLRAPGLVVLDIRSAIDGGSAETYAQGHIPGAIHSDYDKAGWRATRNGLPYMLPGIAQLEKLIGELGIDETNDVVVVPAGVSATDFGSAARTYWTLKVAGVRKVSILDGGSAAWTAAKLPLESGVNTLSPTIFEANLDRSLIAEAADVEHIIATGAGTLVDARPPPFFQGKVKADAAQAYGHIPGALNIDSTAFYDETINRLRPKAELAAVAARIPPRGPVVSYCNTGHWSATDWFVLAELLGRKDVKVYYGSMVDWVSVPSRPVASSRTKWDDIKKFFGKGS
ncbi:MAG TPA: sulfurtransferase [Xanthobacteraceae bacterium]|nr:sulfurtransferase [Xanthobacteraceae bacterium]